MLVQVITIFPDFFRGLFAEGVVAKAITSGTIELRVHDLRQWTDDRHKTVDDRPFGGGEGMLLKADPIFRAVEQIVEDRATAKVLLLSAQGHQFDQAMAQGLVDCRELVFICGRYEGVDERVAEHLIDGEISIGDYVLSGGELGAAVVLDAVGRLLPGVLGNADSTVHESFTRDAKLLDCPQYTRPAEYRGWAVPDVLLSGNHAEIEKWRKRAALEKTRRNRPDLLPE
jgi:tRNA (guanine37-N1)-methyltransferase